jgi:hypothetical protein
MPWALTKQCEEHLWMGRRDLRRMNAGCFSLPGLEPALSSAGGIPAYRAGAFLPLWTPKTPKFGCPRNRGNFTRTCRPATDRYRLAHPDRLHPRWRGEFTRGQAFLKRQSPSNRARRGCQMMARAHDEVTIAGGLWGRVAPPRLTPRWGGGPPAAGPEAVADEVAPQCFGVFTGRLRLTS